MQLTITKDQAQLILTSLSYAYNDDYPKTDSINARVIRLTEKIKNLMNQ